MDATRETQIRDPTPVEDAIHVRDLRVVRGGREVLRGISLNVPRGSAGYAIAFGLLAALQAATVCVVGFALLGLDAPHGAALVGLLAIANALLGMALGLLVSAFASTEFQAVQFTPALIFPQLLLCGLFVARDAMGPLLEALSWALPLTYAYDALARATDPAALGSEIWGDLLVVAAAALAALALGALTLRRRTP